MSQAVGEGHGWGKVILLGEHVVVYGRPAMAGAIDRILTVRARPADARVRGPEAAETDPRLREACARAEALCGFAAGSVSVEVDSQLPTGVGLGSSGALSVALIRALASLHGEVPDDERVSALAFEIEKIFHGTPSGIDNAVSAFGGLMAFSRVGGARRLTGARPVPLVVALGRAPRETKRVVADLRHRWTRKKAAYEALFDDVAALVEEAEVALEAGDMAALGQRMNANHEFLVRLGVSTDELDAMVTLAQHGGALGAKLTGAGGGGAVICLCAGNRGALTRMFAKEGWRAFATDAGTKTEIVHDGALTSAC